MLVTHTEQRIANDAVTQLFLKLWKGGVRQLQQSTGYGVQHDNSSRRQNHDAVSRDKRKYQLTEYVRSSSSSLSSFSSPGCSSEQHYL